jgi:hypothetical protein
MAIRLLVVIFLLISSVASAADFYIAQSGAGSANGRGKVLKLPDISACRKLKITSGAAQAADRVFVVFGN